MHRQNGSRAATPLLAAANILLPVAILIFAIGFFPYKPFLPGLAQYQDLDYGQSPPSPPFDRLIFMVVDALRSDFVFQDGTGFEFTQRLIADGVALPYTAHATSPTITMPRIKAITTGSTPSFLDSILSFDEGDTSSTLAVQDTWLAQMKARDDRKLLMYGDDTWLRLFPGIFDRVDGTSSFFVSDFTEVDNNVTRHIADELQNDDWNTMVLHYLGMDHIGHKTGPRGPNMIPKQREMDGIVRQLYEAIETQPHLESTLLVFLGDHGMNDAGNHGASSPGETSAALVFASPKLRAVSKPVKAPADYVEDFQYYSVVEQSDLAPTLAALLGFPIPKNNLGAFIRDFLPLWPQSSDQMQILMRNAHQILNIITATFGGSADELLNAGQSCSEMTSPAEVLACQWQSIRTQAEILASEGAEVDQGWSTDIARWLSEAQSFMTGMASDYNMDLLLGGGAVATVATVMAALAAALYGGSPFRSWAPMLLITLLYGIMMFASSYVEEEQHFWYWVTSAWVVYICMRRAFAKQSRNSFVVTTTISLLAVRVIRSWNQTGQKFAGEPDLVTIFLLPQPQLLWSLTIATYAVFAREIYEGLQGAPVVLTGPIVSGLATAAVSFKLAFTKEDAPELVVGFARTLNNLFEAPTLVVRAQAVFMGLLVVSLYPLYSLVRGTERKHKEQAMRALHHIYTMLALTQSRATNIPLFLLFQVLYSGLSQIDLDGAEITTCSLLLQFLSFFAMGGNNTLAGVDLSSAYNGVQGFNVVAVGILTFISNWAGSIWWTSACTLLLLERKRNGAGGGCRLFQQHMAMLTLFTGGSLAFVMAACTALRTHLFIWTVFSPKYLYSMAWSLGQHLAVNVGIGGLLYWMGSS